MADSIEDIVNLALVVIGQTKQIDDLTADDSEAADVANLVYEQDRDEVLSVFSWPFATSRAKPAPVLATSLDLGAVPGGWSYAYARPADALRVRSIFTAPGALPDSGADFAEAYDPTLGARVILSNDDAPEFLFTFRVTDVKQFPPLFVRALAGRLAEDLALGLRKDPKVGQVVHAYYLQALAEAKADALKGQHTAAWTPAHIAART
jgi:hypothetical protein